MQNRRLSIAIPLALLTLTSIFWVAMVVPKVHAAPSWFGPLPVEIYQGLDLLPTAIQAQDGKIWVAWETNRYGLSRYDILYKTMIGGAWSNTLNFTTSGQNSSPGLVQLNNGTIMMFWSVNVTTNYNMFYSRYNGGAWSPGVRLTTGSYDDTLNAAVVTRAGTLWLVWTRNVQSCPTCIVDRQLYFRTLTGNAWTPEARLSTDTNWNWGASLMVSKDGRVWVGWSKGAPQQSNFGIYFKTYNGTVWSADTQLTATTNADSHPSLLQDRNGTIWSFWGRTLTLSPTLSEIHIFSKYSLDNGSTWTADSQMTSSPTGKSVNDQMPIAVQATDYPIWVFYSSNRNLAGGSPIDPDIHALKSSPISPVHDVTISNIRASNTIQYKGGMQSVFQDPIVFFYVNVSNPGDALESVTVSLSVSNMTTYNLGPRTAQVAPKGSIIIAFPWDTTNGQLGWYKAVSTVTPVAGESIPNRGDNSLTTKSVIRIIPPGDINQDGSVTITDVGIFFYDFGFTPGTPDRWEPLADINNNGIIDIIDTGVAVRNFGIVS